MNTNDLFYVKTTITRRSTDTIVYRWYCIPKAFPNGELVSPESFQLTLQSIRMGLLKELPGWLPYFELKEEKEYSEFCEFELDFI